MKIAFTICSNNYLSQAKALGDSLIKYNPEYKFIIGLCDKKSDLIDYSIFKPAEIIEVEKLNIDNFDWMVYNYSIIELNTSIKPFFFCYFFQQYKNLEIAIYFDPDIKIYDSLRSIEAELENKSTLLTPHILSPIANDNKKPDEAVFLNYGIYNLGFIAIKPHQETMEMLEWWSKKLSNECFDIASEGIFVDQLPMNFAPIFYAEVKVSKNPGYNFAYWNFHERTLSEKNSKYFINEIFPLVFLHFSNFKPAHPINITNKQTRFTLEKNTSLYSLFSEYTDILIDNKYYDFISIPCYYSVLRKNLRKKDKSIFYKIKKIMHLN